jgi:hypothetical protein
MLGVNVKLPAMFVPEKDSSKGNTGRIQLRLKIEAAEKKAIQALRPSDFASAFGRAEARERAAVMAGLKPRPFKNGMHHGG